MRASGQTWLAAWRISTLAAAGPELGEGAGPRRLVRRDRPRAVGVIVVALAVEALLLAVLSVVALSAAELLAWPPTRLEQDWLFVGFGLALSLLVLMSALGLLAMRPGAWLLAMTTQGLNLAHALVDYALGQPDYATMVLGVAIVLALQQSEVRQAFRADHG